jgi:hypothetical protein
MRLLVIAVAALASAGTASAQVGTGAPWSLNGSDTLEQMIRQSIVNSTNDGTLTSVGNRCQTANSLVARGHCTTGGAVCSTTSGGVACAGTTGPCVNDAATSQACATSPDDCSTFHSLAACRTTSELFYAGGGSTTGETNLRNNVQSIAPMSRNFRDTVLFTSSAQTTRRSFCRVNPTVECTNNPGACTGTNDACELRQWDLIYPRNAVALDAGVIVTKQGGVTNIQLPIVGINESEAAPNTDPGNFSILSPGTGYTQILAVVLGGVDGSGTFQACSDPRRINAINDLATFQGITSGSINHFYRRDDNSGTTDTFKEKLKIDRFCNGRAVGINGSNKSSPNLNNMDMDPIRRPCPVVTSGRPAKCTDVTVNPPVACTSGTNCTQGLVVALSVGDNDTDLADVTTTIGARVNSDPDSVGFAGREAIRAPGALLTAPSIRNRTSIDDSIRIGFYMLSRRLFLQFADQDGTASTDVTNNTLAATGGAARIDAERRLWNWISDPDTGGRCNFDPIVKQFGFISCLNDCSEDPCNVSGNLCCTANPLFPGAPTACVPGSSGGGPAFWPVNDGTATNQGGTCSSGQICCSTGETCPANGICPEVALLQTDAPCGKDSDCANGSCSDAYGIGINVCN